MANQPINPPVQPAPQPIAAKDVLLAGFLASPEGRSFLDAQTELSQLQLDEIRERREQTLTNREHKLKAQRQNARAQEAARLKRIQDQQHCAHKHPNGGVALAGQRFSRGGARDWILMCQLCGAEFDNKNPPKDPTLQIKLEFFGGPNF